MDNCNAVADGKCLRYRKGWQDSDFGKKNFAESFQARIDTICTDLEESLIPNDGSAIFGGDARKIMMSEGDASSYALRLPPI